MNTVFCHTTSLLEMYQCFSKSYSLNLPKVEADIRFFHEIYYICYRLHSISLQKTVIFSHYQQDFKSHLLFKMSKLDPC